MRYKFCKSCENRARDTPLRGVYIPDFGQIWVKISILGVLHPCRCTDGGEIWHGGFSPLLRAKFHPHRCNVSPLRGEKPQHWPLSKLNTGRFALRAMLPVTKHKWLKKYFLAAILVRWITKRRCLFTERLSPLSLGIQQLEWDWRQYGACVI